MDHIKTHLRRRRRKSLQSRIHRPHNTHNSSTDRRLAHDAAQRRVRGRPTVRDGAEKLPRLISTNEEQPTVDLVRERRRPPRRLNHNLPGPAAPRLEVRVHGSRDRGGARPLAMCQRQQRLEVRRGRRGRRRRRVGRVALRIGQRASILASCLVGSTILMYRMRYISETST